MWIFAVIVGPCLLSTVVLAVAGEALDAICRCFRQWRG